MTRRTYRAPLLVTRCNGCFRRRACAPVIFWHWLCRECIERTLRKGQAALRDFAAQGVRAGR